MKNAPYLLITALWLFSGAGTLAQDAGSLLKEGVAFRGQKKIPEAIDRLRKAVALKPDLSEAHYELGWCYNDLKEYSSAMNSLRIARHGWPNIPKVYFELGYAFEKLGMTDSAIGCFNRCLQLKPDYSNAHLELGNIAYEKDDYESALSFFNQYEKYAKTPPTSYLLYYRKGFCYNNQKKFDSALLSLDRSAQLKPDHFTTWLELGYANTRLKRADEAIRCFSKAIAIDAKSHIPYNGIGEVYRDIKKDRNEAMSWYQKALGVKANERKACYGMGFCLNTFGRFTDAIPYLKTAIQQESTYVAAYVELGYSYYKTGNNTDAIANLKKAIGLSPQNENARFYLTLVYIGQRDKVRAQQVVDELKRLSSKYADELQERINAMR